MPILDGTTGLPLVSTKKSSKLKTLLVLAAEDPPKTLVEVLQLNIAIQTAALGDWYARGVTVDSVTSETTPKPSETPQTTLTETTGQSQPNT